MPSSSTTHNIRPAISVSSHTSKQQTTNSQAVKTNAFRRAQQTAYSVYKYCADRVENYSSRVRANMHFPGCIRSIRNPFKKNQAPSDSDGSNNKSDNCLQGSTLMSQKDQSTTSSSVLSISSVSNDNDDAMSDRYSLPSQNSAPSVVRHQQRSLESARDRVTAEVPGGDATIQGLFHARGRIAEEVNKIIEEAEKPTVEQPFRPTEQDVRRALGLDTDIKVGSFYQPSDVEEDSFNDLKIDKGMKRQNTLQNKPIPRK